MNQPFIASEVREEAGRVFGDSSALGMESRARRRAMLRAYADRLEADEKAVPVGYAHKGYLDKGCLNEQLYVTRNRVRDDQTSLYTHPAPADAEKLVEALREIAREQSSVDGSAAADYFQRIAKTALAAHSAQVQPPAASATPNLASYWRLVAEAAEVLQMVLDSGVKLPPNWRWPLLDELSGLSAMMLAAQENPNG